MESKLSLPQLETQEKAPVLCIYPQRLQQNFRKIRDKAQKPLIAVVKRNGYGMGLDKMSKRLYEAGQRFFAVSDREEALLLKEQLPDCTVLLLTPEEEIKNAVLLLQKDIQLSLGSVQDGEILRKAMQISGCIAHIHIMLDTGLGRYGFTFRDLRYVPQAVQGMQLAGCYTHITARKEKKILACYRLFQKGLKFLQEEGLSIPLTHIGGSTAALCLAKEEVSCLRIGSALLGRTLYASQWELEDCLQLLAPIQRESLRQKGDTVGYGRSIRLGKPTRVGILPIGHGDGLFLSGSERICILSSLLCLLRHTPKPCAQFGKKQLPVLGGIGMGQTLIDLKDAAQKGDWVSLPVNPLYLRSHIQRLELHP